jgi:hypothetical protein
MIMCMQFYYLESDLSDNLGLNQSAPKVKGKKFVKYQNMKSSNIDYSVDFGD